MTTQIKMKNNMQGITLVALVVTIIVLLILAGITINLLFSNNGIIERAQQSKNEWSNAENSELNNLKNVEDVLNQYTNGGNITKPTPEDGYSKSKGVNIPKLGLGMTPIKWDATAKSGVGDWVETTENDEEWYNYTESDKKWANAKTEDGSMWVWIPRYAYQIANNWHNGGTDISGTINIKFLKGTTNEASDGTNNWDNASKEGNWNVHPAFSYGSEVSGIWVAKFEASPVEGVGNSAEADNVTSKKIQVKPGVQSWRNITISNIYMNCLNYNSTLNSHQMKNSEWGAVAYLTQSAYGKNSEVIVNSDSSYYTGGGSEVAYINNTVQSTTGNVYGIYDMSGGSWEHVAAYVNSESSYAQTYGAEVMNSTIAKTKDIYDIGEPNTEATNYEIAKVKYGDAVYETSLTYNDPGSSWYGDCSIFPTLNYPFFRRGGGYSNGTSTAGLFYFYNCSGSADKDYSFRPVLAIL